jgi:ketosteroid isomerase-like protein
MHGMKVKIVFLALCFALIAVRGKAQVSDGSEEDMKSLDKATLAIRQAFEKGNAGLAASLHHPDIVKYFGGKNVVTGRDELKKGLAEWFQNSQVEFVENTVESTVFAGNTAIQSVIFAIKSTPKKGGEPVISRGRSMVIYVRDRQSPTGWLSLREMTQEAPEKTE